MRGRGLSERKALKIVKMSASALRYRPRPDRNVDLRKRIVELAQRHRRYGAGMIYLKLRQGGEVVNHKRVERLYSLEGLQIKRRRRKKVPPGDRQPLLRPSAANAVWSMDFIFDRVGSGRQLIILGIVDDGTTEALVTHADHAIGGHHLVRVIDRVCQQRGYPGVIRSDNGREFTSRAMLSWAHDRNVQLKLIEPGKPNQNAYIESFNGRFRDECLNEPLVRESHPCSNAHRTMAEGVQRGAAKEGARRANARRACEANAQKTSYSNRQALDDSATHKGVTSAGDALRIHSEPEPRSDPARPRCRGFLSPASARGNPGRAQINQMIAVRQGTSVRLVYGTEAVGFTRSELVGYW